MTLNDLIIAVQELKEAYVGPNYSHRDYVRCMCDVLINKIKAIGEFR